MFKLNKCDYFVLIWVLYYLQGTLYTAAVINKILQLIMFIWFIVIFYFVTQDSNKPKLLRATSALFAMYLIYGAIHILFGRNLNIGYQVQSYFYLQKASNSLLPIFLFYYYTRKGYVSEKRMRIYFLVFLITSIVLYLRERTHMYDIATANQTGVTNNAVYGILALIPMVYYFYKKPLIQYILLAVLLFFVVMGAKRGAILAGGICMLYFVLVSFRSNRKKIYAFFLSALFVVLAFYYIEYTFRTNDYLAYRYEQTLDGNSSNRDIIYEFVWRAFWSESSVFSLLLGHGADATLSILGNFAHQDWLEIAFNNGIVGVYLFAMFFVGYIIDIKKVKHSLTSWYLHAFVTVFIIGLAKSFFSAFISQIDLCMSLVIGYTLAELVEKKKKTINSSEVNQKWNTNSKK